MVEQRAIWEQIASDVARVGQGMTRAEVAAKFGISKGTALVHLEKAVQRGALQKIYTFTSGHYRGWVYLSPGAIDSFQDGAA